MARRYPGGLVSRLRLDPGRERELDGPRRTATVASDHLGKDGAPTREQAVDENTASRNWRGFWAVGRLASTVKTKTSQLNLQAFSTAETQRTQRKNRDFDESEARDTLSSPRALRLCGEIFLL